MNLFGAAMKVPYPYHKRRYCFLLKFLCWFIEIDV